MRVLVVGGSGMLGHDVVAEAQRRSWDVVAPASSSFDITNPLHVAELPAGSFGNVDVVINCAGYTAVDRAESEPQAATELNAIAPGYLATASAQAGAQFIHISTDYVFDGTATEPYPEDAPTHPLSVYGRTKRDGEVAVMESNPGSIIFRTSWLYGVHGPSFPRAILRAAEAGKPLRVVADQTGRPTATVDLATAICDAWERRLYPGLYHAAGSEVMTWWEFANRILSGWQHLRGSTEAISAEPIPTEAWPTAAVRPRYSVLSLAKLTTNGVVVGNRGLDAFLSHVTA